MLFELLATDMYVSYNVKLAKTLGLTSAIYLSELININRKAIEKNKIKDGYFKINREYIEDREIDYGQRKSAADSSVGHFAYIFDFNFTYGLKYIEKNQYLDKFYNRFKDFEDEKTKERYEKIYKLAKEYIREKIDEG